MATDFPGRGTKMSEVDLLGMFIENMRHAEECARGMAVMRGDLRWVRVARVIGEARDKAIEMASRKIVAN